MPRLSVAMIVKNEAACVGRCLGSVRPVADEIVVCDTGSTDNTAEVAAALGARVDSIPWRDDFAAARNESLARVTGEWILHMDADEELDSAGAARIRAIVDADGAGADAIEVTLANYCNDVRAWRWRPVAPGDPMARGIGGYIPVPLLRLFRNGRGFEYREPVHENITESVRENGGVVRVEPIIIHHYGYAGLLADAGDREKARAKRVMYLDIARRKAQERPGDPKAWHDLAEQALALGAGEEAETAARQAVTLAPRDLAAATSLANLLLTRGEFDEARHVLEPFAGADAPAHVLTALGAVAFRQGRIRDARVLLEQAVADHPWAVQAKGCLARVLEVEGDPDGARALLDAAVATAPGIEELHTRLRAHDARRRAESAIAADRLPEALRLLGEALALDAEDPLVHRAIGLALGRAGQHGPARESFARATRLCGAIRPEPE